MMVWRYMLKTLLLPPALPLWLMALGWWGAWRRRRWGLPLIGVGATLLYALSTPWVAEGLLRSLERFPPLAVERLTTQRADAIVVLAAGRYLGGAEFGQPRMDAASAQRVVYAAFVHRHTDLPVMTTGGAVLGDGPPAGLLMARSLVDDRGVPPNAVMPEGESRTTWESARRVRRYFVEEAPPRILLVTHAWHMPRAVLSFEAAGFDVIAAPTRFSDRREHRLGPLWVLPDAAALADSRRALHEWLGLAVYRLRAWAAREGDDQ